MYIRLRALRADQGLHQKELGEIIGVTQSVISRMEKAHAELDDIQYSRLVKRFGEAEVAKYLGESPLQNVMGRPRRNLPPSIPEELSMENALAMQAKTIELLTETNHIQQQTIETQAQLIAWLKDRLIEK